MNDAGAVLVDANGDPIPLVTNQAVDLLTAPDPQFCPDGGGACSPNRTTIVAAIADALAAGTPGTINIQTGTYNEASIVITGFTNALTLQGASPWPTINGQIYIKFVV
jgi:hypothetical protein